MADKMPPPESPAPPQSASEPEERADTPSQLPAQTQAYPGDAGSAPARSNDTSLDFLAPPEAPDELGRLSTYRVLAKLSSGGMGIVFAAEDVQLRRPVALKVMQPELRQDHGACERFLREAQAAAALCHENVVTVFQVGLWRDMPFLAMELLHGETLQERMEREGRPRLADLLRIGRQIAAGLAAAHERALIHRDIKPSNIFLVGARGEGRATRKTSAESSSLAPRVKILDFGLARRENGEARLTQSGVAIGTPHFMAPEQAAGDPVDHRCDLFSLGCVLYRMATGHLPFAGSNMRAVLKAVMFETPTAVRELVSDLPPTLVVLIERLMAKEPKDRPQSADEVVDALTALEAELIVRPQPAATSPAVTDEYPRPAEARTWSPPASDAMTRPAIRSQRRRWVWAGAGLIVLAGIVVAFVLWNPFKPKPAPPYHMEADDVLNRLVGTWSVENVPSIPESDPERGTARYDWIGNKQFLRGYTRYDVSGAETLTLFRHDADAKVFRRWFFTSGSGLPSIQGPADGQWDATTATLTWRGTLPLSHKVVHDDHWFDADNFETRTEVKDHQGKVFIRQTKKMHRLATNETVGPTRTRDPNGPAELAVLDGLVGSWTTTAEVTVAELGNRKYQAKSTNQSTAILGGRFVETQERRDSDDRWDYMLIGWDDLRQTYRFWHFGPDGDVMEADGTWDKDEKKLTWKSLDGRFSGTWTLPNANEQHAVFTIKDSQGRRLYEVDTVSRRVGAKP
jgi:serine/threonine protein kinase